MFVYVYMDCMTFRDDIISLPLPYVYVLYHTVTYSDVYVPCMYIVHFMLYVCLHYILYILYVMYAQKLTTSGKK
jgi:hypothetical protein